MSFSGVTATVQ